ncbi:mobilization protein [Endozoicomonas sp. SM1973]|uniref:Mobilization protein n=1 Tax=Spartinivicinus marinus TaxID=2994442 RepID=A0A853IIP5_9GAMM|nr:mobilization protein [Spartinivicinus marinus]NYZ70368.1 mobilization protein [Spartinivicinus marinus]
MVFDDRKTSDVDAQLAKLKEKEKQLKAQIQAAEARAKEKQRKVETRQKIILGGAVLSLLKNEQDEDFRQALVKKLDTVVKRESDRKTLRLSNRGPG